MIRRTAHSDRNDFQVSAGDRRDLEEQVRVIQWQAVVHRRAES